MGIYRELFFFRFIKISFMKKNLISILFLVVLIPSVIAQKVANNVKATIKNGEFTLGKISVASNWEIAPVTDVLNEMSTSFKKKGLNTTHTYDALGIVLFEKNNADRQPSGIVSEIQIYFEGMDTTGIPPNEVFTGVLKIEKLRITGTVNSNDVKENLKDYKLSDSYIEHTYRFSLNGIYLYILFNDAEDKLLKLSIGKDMRKD
jgi:hypothetical protein